jgi:hypothetical protein
MLDVMLARNTIVLAVLAALVAACASPLPAPPAPIEARPVPLTPPAEQSSAPVVRREIVPPAETPPSAPPSALTSPAVIVPSDAIYVCVVDASGTRRQTVIEFVPKVLDLCRRHPEMGPCQYERNVCRAAGGRVYAANGEEITLRTEAEYDRKVLRVRFRAN